MERPPQSKESFMLTPLPPTHPPLPLPCPPLPPPHQTQLFTSKVRLLLI